MNIGEAAKASGVSAKMIRHYEAIGLTRDSLRSASGYRLYGEKEVHVLRFIKQARNLGFSLEQISQLLSLWQNQARASADVKALAKAHILRLNGKIDELTEMRDVLDKLVSACSGDQRPDCPILSGLAEKRAAGASGPHREA